MKDSLNILHLEDDPVDIVLTQTALHAGGIPCKLFRVDTREDFVAALEKGGVDLVLADASLPSFDGLSALEIVRSRWPDLPFILVTGTLGEEFAIDSMKLGGTDYVLKQRLSRLVPAVRRALNEAEFRVEQQATQRKLLRQASLLDAAQDAILVSDLQNCIEYWNKGAERVYGWSEQEVMGRNVSELLYPEPGPLKACMEAVCSKGLWVGELLQCHKDGRILTVEAHWTLVRDDQGEPQSILCINTDVTERKRLEQQFLRAQRLESLGTLASGIAHDLNNVLAPILLSIEYLRLGEEDQDKIDTLKTIEASTRHGADMVKQVLSFGRGLDGSRSLVHIDAVVKELENILRDTLPKNIDIQVELMPDLWTVNADPTQIHQVLLNLSVNARDAMPDGGRLRIKCENINLLENFSMLSADAKSGPYVCIHVEDNGTGIPTEIADKVFDPFFTTKAPGKGTGLGLSTSVGIVKNHGGFINLYSEPNRGTSFKIYLPASSEPVPELIQTLPKDLPRGNGEMILVVDDEPAVRKLASKVLQAFGYRVNVAADGEEALAVYSDQRGKIALVITDIMMPVMDGVKTIENLKKINPNVRVVAASGLYVQGRGPRLLDAGIKHFLSKPYTAETLLNVVKRALSDE